MIRKQKESPCTPPPVFRCRDARKTPLLMARPLKDTKVLSFGRKQMPATPEENHRRSVYFPEFSVEGEGGRQYVKRIKFNRRVRGYELKLGYIQSVTLCSLSRNTQREKPYEIIKEVAGGDDADYEGGEGG
ncbi:hypothetical protein GWI33_011945 [Rhynchophorus ferrugineus]|uniref:Uncharacterized protein n=1 Tax=Rhynchophorus ferrugineus TaxID=354439 RepID=A0A834IRK0_RHYFE|nr:hypothetical protein GWI33_011945 [Rhynchophorus ferrugineus]